MRDAAMPAAAPAARERVVEAGDAVANGIPAGERIAESDQAAEKRHAVTREELAEQSQVWPDHAAALEDQPVRRDEHGETDHEACRETLDDRIEMQRPREDDILECLFSERLGVVRHDGRGQ